MKRRLSGIVVAAMALALIVGASTNAEAAFFALICDDINCSGGGDLAVVDGGAGDVSPVVGMINMSFVTGGMSVVVNVSQSKPLIGSPGQPQLDLSFVATGVGNVWLFATDTDFTGTGAPFLQLGGTQPGNGPGGFVDGRAWGGDSNAPFDIIGNLLVNLADQLGTPFSVSGSGPLVGFGVNPYSLTIGVNVVRTGAGTTTGDLNLVVPEPATMALFGLGLMGFGAASRRRRQQK